MNENNNNTENDPAAGSVSSASLLIPRAQAKLIRLDGISLSSCNSYTEDEYWAKVMEICGQQHPLHFGLKYPSRLYRDMEYIDSGTYSHVIKAVSIEQNMKFVVFKVIRIVQKGLYQKLNELTFKGYEYYADVYQEIAITRMLSSLHEPYVVDGLEYRTHCFPRIFNASIVQGEIPNYFLIKKYSESRSKAKPIERFEDYYGVPKEHLVLVMKYCGDSLWNMMQYPFRTTRHNTIDGVTPDQLISICLQLTLALAVSEGACQFEHRDLHICNVLVKPTKKDHVLFRLRSETFAVKSFGVKAIIIDATFSRMAAGAEIFYTDLTNRLKGTANLTEPDAQELAYQRMYNTVGDRWRQWFPVTNIFWAKYFYIEIKTCEAFSIASQVHRKKLDQLIDPIDRYACMLDFVKAIWPHFTDYYHEQPNIPVV